MNVKKFLKLKVKSITIFIIYLFLLCLSSLFNININYIIYIIIISTILFIINLILSYKSFKNLLNIISQWAKEPYNAPPNIIKDSELSEVISYNYKNSRENLDNINIKFSKLKDYVTIWTHQIKTPLFSLDLILNDDEIDISQAKNELFEIDEYINTLLSYIRLESSSTDYIFEDKNLDELLRSSVRKYSKVFIKKKNQMDFKKTEKIITTDEKWFSFIIEQILSNSNKYTKEGVISIYMDGTKLVIKDTGIGIRAEDLPRVFDHSYTGYNGRIYKKSTGIGLNLVKTVSENLNIDVNIESEVDKGTRVILDLSKILK